MASRGDSEKQNDSERALSRSTGRTLRIASWSDFWILLSVGIRAPCGLPLLCAAGIVRDCEIGGEYIRGVSCHTLPSGGTGNDADGLGIGISYLTRLVSATWRSTFVG